MFVASMNPCECGYYGSKEKECTCTEKLISRYMGKISGPLLDRIDIQVEVTPVKYQKLDSSKQIETSEQIRESKQSKKNSNQKVSKPRNLFKFRTNPKINR